MLIKHKLNYVQSSNNLVKKYNGGNGRGAKPPTSPPEFYTKDK